MTKLWMAISSMVFAVGLFFPSLPISANTNPNPTQVKPEIVSLTGTVRKLEVEGICYQLAADNGQKYELMGKFPKQDGVRLRVKGLVANDVATICQVGQPFKVKSVRVIRQIK
jgi:hypothetical protein